MSETIVHCSGCDALFYGEGTVRGAQDHALDNHTPDEFDGLIFTDIAARPDVLLGDVTA